MAYDEDEYLSLSGIQHFEFCRRQWALIHIEQQWDDNYRTVDGILMHKNAHDCMTSGKNNDVLIAKALPIHSKIMGVFGICDVVEFRRTESEGISLFGYDGQYKANPIEYKRGLPKVNDEDVVQLTAQAMCLEEMLNCSISKAYLYYGETRHRFEVILDERIRNLVINDFLEMHSYFERSFLPKPKRTKSCNACSLKDICLPELNCNTSSEVYIKQMIGSENDEKTP